MPQTFTGKQYLMMDIAGLFGLDKKTWNERLDWFSAHEHELESFTEQADSRNCYLAAVNAWRDVQAGKPIGYAMNLDATASGCQMFALATGDKKAAARVNLINTGKREDLYSYIYQIMINKAQVSDRITRDKVKKSIMTSLYGSEAKPKEVFGEQNYELFTQVMDKELHGVWRLNRFLLEHWDPTKTVYSWVMPDNFHVDCHVINSIKYSCKCMDQDIEFIKKIEQPTEKGKFLSANLAHSLDGLANREIVMRCSFSKEYKEYLKKILNLNAIFQKNDKNNYNYPKANLCKFKTLWERYKASGFLSVRILQDVTPETLKLVGVEGIQKIAELVNTLPENTFEVYSIHDCFRCLPNYGNDLRQQYRYICKQIADSYILDDIVSSMLGEEIHFKKMSNDLGELVLQSEYALC